MTQRAKLTASVFAGVLVLILAVAAYLLIPRRATYTLHGTEIVTTTASGEQLGSLLQQTARAIGDVKDLGDGRSHFPSFRQSGRSWGGAAGETTSARILTEFDDKNGNHYTIERISISGEPDLLLLTSSDPKTTMDLANEVMRQFQRLNVRHKE